MKKKFKILAISDTHNKHKQCEKLFPEGDFDMVIHTGDLTMSGYSQEIKEFFEWFSKLHRFKYKLVIAGNHDFLFEEKPEIAKDLIPDNVIYLEDSGIEIEGIKFWGSPITPWFHAWAFNRNRGEEIKKHWDLIPNDINVLLTHGPAYLACDYVQHVAQYVGCEDLAYKLNEIEPIAHIFGHIHEGYGKKYNHGTIFYNASQLDGNYFAKNPGHIIEIEFDENNKPFIDVESQS